MIAKRCVFGTICFAAAASLFQGRGQRQMRHLAFLLSLISLSACIPITTVVHDGVTGFVVDSETKQPLAGAFVYDGITNGLPHILTKSDSLGQIELSPNTRLLLLSLWVRR